MDTPVTVSGRRNKYNEQMKNNGDSSKRPLHTTVVIENIMPTLVIKNRCLIGSKRRRNKLLSHCQFTNRKSYFTTSITMYNYIIFDGKYTFFFGLYIST